MYIYVKSSNQLNSDWQSLPPADYKHDKYKYGFDDTKECTFRNKYNLNSGRL